MRWVKSRINNIPTTNCVQLGIENYIWIWWYNYSILMLFMPITGSNLSYEKHMRMKVEREGPTLKLTPLNTCLSPNDLWTSLHSMSTSWSSSIWPFKSLLLDKVELYSTCPRKTIHQDKLHSMAIQLNTKKNIHKIASAHLMQIVNIAQTRTSRSQNRIKTCLPSSQWHVAYPAEGRNGMNYHCIIILQNYSIDVMKIKDKIIHQMQVAQQDNL